MHLSRKNKSPNSESIYAAIFDRIGSPILIIDAQTAMILDVNEAACKFYGYSHEDFIQKKIFDLTVLPVEEAWQRIRKIAAGEITHMTLQHRLASGEIRDVEVDLGTEVFGETQVNIATVHDITEREQAKQELQASEKNYRLLFQNMNEGFSLYEVIYDENGRPADARILAANAAYEHHTGLKPEEVIGKTILEVMPQTTLEQLDPYFKVAHTGEPISREYFSPVFQRYFHTTTFCPQPGQFATLVEDITDRKMAEDALHESEERYHSLFDNMSEGFALQEIIQDESGRVVDFRILDANPAYESHTGQRLEEVIGHTIRETMPNADPAMIERYGEVALTGNPLDFEYYSKTFNRHIRVRSFRPQLNQFASVFEDITERKIAEDALLESEARFSTIFHSSHDAISIARLSDDVYLDVNESFCNIFGVTREQAIGHTGRELNIAAAPAQREEFIRRIRSQGQVANFESEFHNHAGETGFLLISGQIVQISGQECLVIFGKDITLRKKAEAALQSAHDELEVKVQERTAELRKASNLLVEGQRIAHLGSFEYIAATKTTAWSEEEHRIYGYEPTQASPDYETMLTKSIHPLDADLLHQTFSAAMETGSVYELEHRIVRPDGSVRWVYDRAHPYYDENGQLIRYVGVTLDTTDRKQSEEKLIQTNIALEKALRTKDEFMAAMSHELRTPLAGILGMSEMLKMTDTNLLLTEKQLKYITSIESNGQRLLKLINNVLEFTQLQSSFSKPNMAPCILDITCSTALQKIAMEAGAKKQVAFYSANPDGMQIITDEKRLSKALTLLLENASKFTNQNGQFGIQVTSREDTKSVDITVWDTGIGISEDNLPHLFQTFTQLDARLAREYEGMGLGLAMVKGIIELLGGTVAVQSKLGEGSRFTINLPRN